MIWLYLQELISNNRSNVEFTVLHFAPELCFERIFEPYFRDRYMTCDIEKGVAKHQVDITDIQYPEENFDLIICSHIMEHVPDDKKAFAELYRVLKPGGHAVIAVPIKGEITDEDLSIVDPKIRTSRFGQSDHVRYYGLDIQERIRAAGFSVQMWTSETLIYSAALRKTLGIVAASEKAPDMFFVAKKDK